MDARIELMMNSDEIRAGMIFTHAMITLMKCTDNARLFTIADRTGRMKNGE